MAYDDIYEICDKICGIKAPEHWKEEGVEDPSEEVMEASIGLICDIFEKIEEFPEVIAPTVENGIYLRYKRDNISMVFEIYNEDLSVGCLINNDKDKEILFSEDLGSSSLEQVLYAFEMES